MKKLLMFLKDNWTFIVIGFLLAYMLQDIKQDKDINIPAMSMPKVESSIEGFNYKKGIDTTKYRIEEF